MSSNANFDHFSIQILLEKRSRATFENLSMNIQLENELQSNIWSRFNWDSIRTGAPEQHLIMLQLRFNQKRSSRAPFYHFWIKIQLENGLQRKIW